jgi:hypothetical protein
LWRISKGLLSEYDTLGNTGMWKGLATEIGIVILSPYPMLNEVKYSEFNEAYNVTLTYDVND